MTDFEVHPPGTAERIEKLEAALKPFALAAEAFEPMDDNDNDLMHWHSSEANNLIVIGHLRRARKVLEAKE